MKKRQSGNNLLFFISVLQLSVSFLFVMHLLKLIWKQTKNYAANNVEKNSFYIIFLFYMRLLKKVRQHFLFPMTCLQHQKWKTQLQLQMRQIQILKNVQKQYIHDLREHHCHLKDLLRSWMKARIKLKLCKPEPLKNGRPPPQCGVCW